MTPEQSNDSEVQRMLALKRHEQPPTEFFQGFSDKVMDRIQSAGPAPRPTLRQRLSIEFYGVPIYLCAAGVIVCGLLVVGLITSLRVGPASRLSANPGAPQTGHEPSHTLVPPPPTPPLAKQGSAPSDRSGELGPEAPAALSPTRATLVAPEAPPR